MSLQEESEARHERTEVFKFVRVGQVVYAVRQSLRFLRTLLHLAYALSHSAVGEEHELLDELVGILCLLEVDAERLACLVNLKSHFLAVEVDGSALEACCTELLGELVEHDEHLCVFLAHRLHFLAFHLGGRNGFGRACLTL